MSRYLVWVAAPAVIWLAYPGKSLPPAVTAVANQQAINRFMPGSTARQGVTVYGGSDVVAVDRLAAIEQRRKYWARQGVAVYGGSDVESVDRMAAAELQRKHSMRRSVSPRPSPSVWPPGYGSYKPRVAENRDVRGADNDGDGRRESIHVRGYYRKDGTYVRGHYRAKSGR